MAFWRAISQALKSFLCLRPITEKWYHLGVLFFAPFRIASPLALKEHSQFSSGDSKNHLSSMLLGVIFYLEQNIQSKILLGNFFQKSNITGKKELDIFFYLMNRNFCGRQGIGWNLENHTGVLPLAFSQDCSCYQLVRLGDTDSFLSSVPVWLLFWSPVSSFGNKLLQLSERLLRSHQKQNQLNQVISRVGHYHNQENRKFFF